MVEGSEAQFCGGVSSEFLEWCLLNVAMDTMQYLPFDSASAMALLRRIGAYDAHPTAELESLGRDRGPVESMQLRPCPMDGRASGEVGAGLGPTNTALHMRHPTRNLPPAVEVVGEDGEARRERRPDERASRGAQLVVASVH